MSSNLKAFHTYFYSLQENLKKKKSSKIERKKKEKRKKNHWADNKRESLLWPWNRKKNEKNLTIRNFFFLKKTNVSVRDTDFANSNLANRKNTDFSFRLSDGILGKLNQKGRSPLKIDQSEYMWAGRPWK